MAELPSGVLPQSRRASTPVALGRRASLFVSAGVIAHTLWTSAAPAMVYRLYADEWHLNHTVTTGPAFGIYGATKAAVRNLVRIWTMELKKTVAFVPTS